MIIIIVIIIIIIIITIIIIIITIIIIIIIIIIIVTNIIIIIVMIKISSTIVNKMLVSKFVRKQVENNKDDISDNDWGSYNNNYDDMKCNHKITIKFMNTSTIGF